jgi:hypothetical protein
MSEEGKAKPIIFQEIEFADQESGIDQNLMRFFTEGLGQAVGFRVSVERAVEPSADEDKLQTFHR